MKNPPEDSLLRTAELINNRMKAFGADYHELHLAAGFASSYLFQDGVLERLSASSAQGASLRSFRNGRWSLASVDSTEPEEVLQLVDELGGMGVDGPGRDIDFTLLPRGVEARAFSRGEIAPEKVPPSDKVALIRRMASAVSSADDGRLRNHLIHYADGGGLRLVSASDGTCVITGGSKVRLGCSVVVRDGDRAQKWTEQIAGPGGFELVKDASEERLVLSTVRKALELLDAPKPPSGRMPVILDPSVTGLFIHECLGHSAEADSVLEGHSLLEGKLGERIGSPLVAIVDDPTLPGAYGYYLFDAEGVPARKTSIIREGVLSEYLHSKETAIRMNSAPNGHGRHSSYGARPLPRMSNTYMEPGSSLLEDMISSIDEGLLLSRGESGYVLSEKGEYTCKVMEAQVIRRGRIDERVGEISFNGEVLDTLHKVVGKSDRLVVSDPAICSKDGQGVAVDAGGPHVLVSEVMVSG